MKNARLLILVLLVPPLDIIRTSWMNVKNATQTVKAVKPAINLSANQEANVFNVKHSSTYSRVISHV